MKSVKLDPRYYNKNTLEYAAWNHGAYVVGVDEVGRGCLAGPVATAAVALPAYTTYHRLKDSKELSQRERELAYTWIEQNAWVAWSLVDPHMIDTLNVYHATAYAMRRAIAQLLVQMENTPHTLIVDGMPISHAGPFHEVYHMSQGERKSTSIAAASIYAKINRDRIMRDMDHVFPAYRLHRHKGYSTQVHKQQVYQHGPSFIHRNTFLRWLDRTNTADNTNTKATRQPHTFEHKG